MRDDLGRSSLVLGMPADDTLLDPDLQQAAPGNIDAEVAEALNVEHDVGPKRKKRREEKS